MKAFKIKSLLSFFASIADFCYRQQIILDGEQVEVEIVDVSDQPNVSIQCDHVILATLLTI